MNREILRLAVPNIVSNLSVPLLGLVDTILMGHLPEADIYLGGIAIAASIFNVLYWSFGFLRMGTTGLTAQAYGAKQGLESQLVLSRGLLVAAIGGLLMLALQVPIEWGGMALMEGSDSAKEIARSYFYIRIFAAPATLGLYVFNGWFLGMQNSVIPLILSVAINLTNIGANLLFVYVFDMKAEGIALGTVCAQYLGLAIAIGFYLYQYGPEADAWKRRYLMQAAALKRFLLVNRDIFIRTACLVFAFTYFVSRSGEFGDPTLAANALLLQLFYLMSYIVDGFAFAAESLVGKYMGSGGGDRLKLVVRNILIWGMCFGSLFSLAYFIAGPTILGWLSNDPQIVNDAIEFLPWLIALPLIGTFAFMWDGVYIGATATTAMRNTMVVSTFLVFLPILLLAKGPLGNHGLWMAMLGFMFARGVLLAIFARSNKLSPW